MFTLYIFAWQQCQALQWFTNYHTVRSKRKSSLKRGHYRQTHWGKRLSFEDRRSKCCLDKSNARYVLCYESKTASLHCNFCGLTRNSWRHGRKPFDILLNWGATTENVRNLPVLPTLKGQRLCTLCTSAFRFRIFRSRFLPFRWSPNNSCQFYLHIVHTYFAIQISRNNQESQTSFLLLPIHALVLGDWPSQR